MEYTSRKIFIAFLGGITMGMGFVGCKKKNALDGGLFDEPSRPSAPVTPASLTALGPAAGGNWKITCIPVENPQDSRVYTIELSGAVSESDENQPVKISISRATKAPVAPGDQAARDIATSEPGRGSVALQGNLFFGFSGGALTGQYRPESKRHEGLLTLVHDQDVAGLAVVCDVVAAVNPMPSTSSPSSTTAPK